VQAAVWRSALPFFLSPYLDGDPSPSMRYWNSPHLSPPGRILRENWKSQGRTESSFSPSLSPSASFFFLKRGNPPPSTTYFFFPPFLPPRYGIASKVLPSFSFFFLRFSYRCFAAGTPSFLSRRKDPFEQGRPSPARSPLSFLSPFCGIKRTSLEQYWVPTFPAGRVSFFSPPRGEDRTFLLFPGSSQAPFFFLFPPPPPPGASVQSLLGQDEA